MLSWYSATPPTRSTKATVVPSMRIRATPPGVPVAGAWAATSARIVTDWPKTDGFGDDVTEVVVAPGSTSCSRELVAPANLASPS